MKKEYISRALADTYHQAAIAGRDMRHVADQLETLRSSIEEKSLYAAWRDIDKAVGQVLLQGNAELFEILNTFRKSFTDWAFESIRIPLHLAWNESPEKGWESFLRLYVDALVNWRPRVYNELHKELDVDSLSDVHMDLYLRIARAVPYMEETRWDEVYELFLELSRLPWLQPKEKVHLLCSAGQIELYFFSNPSKAEAFFDQARNVEEKGGLEFSRTWQSYGELFLQEMSLDKARDAFQKAAQLDPQNEFALLYMGDTYREESRYSIAEAWYDDARNLFPGSSDALLRRIRLFERRDYFEDHDPAMIRKYVDELVRLVPEEEYSALIDAGFAFQSNDAFDEAESWYRTAIGRFPKRGGGWVNLGYVLEKKGLNEEAGEAFLQALQIDPDHFDAHWGLAFLYERMDNRQAEAIQTLETCRSLRPQWDPYILPRIAELEISLGHTEKARTILLDCLAKYPDQDTDPLRLLHEQVDQLTGQAGGLDAALELLKQIRQAKGPGYEANFANRCGNVYYHNGLFDRAEGMYREAIANTPLAVYHENLGLALENQGKAEEALASFQKCIELEPGDGTYYNRIGIFYYNRQQHPEAIDWYRQALERAPGNAVFQNNLALALEANGQMEEAEQAYLAAIELDPENAAYINYLGALLFRADRFAEAVERFAKAVELDPYNGIYFENLGLTWENLGEPEKMQEAFRRAHEAEPASPVFINRLGLGYYNQEQYEQAVSWFGKAVELDPQNPLYLTNLGLAYLNMRDGNRAAEAFDQALSLSPDDELIRNYRSLVDQIQDI